MRFVFRSVLLLAVLASLAYGSYGFGRYVLSRALFSNGIKANAGSVADVDGATRVSGSVAAQSYKGAQPKANVRVLAAEQDGAGPMPPSADVLAQEARGDAANSGPNGAGPRSTVPQDPGRRNYSLRPENGGKDVLTGNSGYRDGASGLGYNDNSGYDNGYDDRYGNSRYYYDRNGNRRRRRNRDNYASRDNNRDNYTPRRRSRRTRRARTASRIGNDTGASTTVAERAPRIERPTRRRDPERAARAVQDAPAPSPAEDSPVPVPE